MTLQATKLDNDFEVCHYTKYGDIVMLCRQRRVPGGGGDVSNGNTSVQEHGGQLLVCLSLWLHVPWQRARLCA